MNRVEILGTIATDIRLQEFPARDGEPRAKASFLVAVRRPGKDQAPDWVRVETWGRLARNLVRFNGKGSRVLVGGRLRGEFYNRDGGERGGELRSAVVAETIAFLSQPKVQEAEEEVPAPQKVPRR